MTDKVLLDLLNSDPQRGLEAIIDEYTGLVYAIAYNKLSSVCSKEDVEECVSDIFMMLYEQSESIDLTRGSIKGLIAILAKRAAIKRYKKACTQKVKLISLDDEDVPAGDLATGDVTQRAALENDERLALINAVKSLGEPDRTIIMSKYFLGLTAKEIAKKVHLSQNAVEKRIARSYIKLSVIMGDSYE